MSVLNFVDSLLRTSSEIPSHFPISQDRVVDPQEEDGVDSFIALASYFEIRLSQMYIRDQREYWREFLPFASIVTEFLFDGERREIPFIVGPERLSKAARVSKGDRVEYLNTRVAGPYPYEGDDLSLFVGLLRTVSGNWAKPTLSLIEAVAEAFDPSKLSSYLNISAPLLTGLESLLGMKDVELRVGRNKSYAAPLEGSEMAANTLRPGYEVILRVPSHELDDATRKKFWVKEGRLFFGDDEKTIREYGGSDFILYQIIPLTIRSDYSTFDFHKVHWKKAQDLIWRGHEDLAHQALRLLASDLVQCPDIIYPHRKSLLQLYKQRFEEEMDSYLDFVDPQPAKGRTFRGDSTLSDRAKESMESVAGPGEVTETDLAKALDSATDQTELIGKPTPSPEKLLTSMDI